jgi:hypothetical protein
MIDNMNPYARNHVLWLTFQEFVEEKVYKCNSCGETAPGTADYCPQCGYYVRLHKRQFSQFLDHVLNMLCISPMDITDQQREDFEKSTGILFEQVNEWAKCTGALFFKDQLDIERLKEGFIFPVTGIYIYHHPYEGYKIGKAEIVPRRIAKHTCAAPSLTLLHVIETSDLDWCERFLHERYRHCRKYPNHEYFDLAIEDLHWLFSIKVLEPPRSEATQHSLLDLL